MSLCTNVRTYSNVNNKCEFIAEGNNDDADGNNCRPTEIDNNVPTNNPTDENYFFDENSIARKTLDVEILCPLKKNDENDDFFVTKSHFQDNENDEELDRFHDNLDDFVF